MRRAAPAAFIAGGLLVAGACSTSQVTPMPEMPEVPVYTRVPHPDSPDLGDIRAIIASSKAPAAEKLKDCDKDFQKLRGLVQSGDELAQGARELVGTFPEEYHWCFYWQLVHLEDKLKTLTYHDERQAEVVRVFSFLTPVAHAFKDQYKDTRYLRSAAYQYKSVSHRVFLRKLTLTPEGAQNLFVGGATEPNALWQGFKPGETPTLEKYGFVPPALETVVTPPAPAGGFEKLPPAETAAAAPPVETAPEQDPSIWAPSAAVEAPPVTEPVEIIERTPADIQDLQSEVTEFEGEIETETRITEGSPGPAPASIDPPVEETASFEPPPEPPAEVQPPSDNTVTEGSELSIDFDAGQGFPEGE